MRKCHKCGAELLDNARFCHNCGEKVIQETLDCPACHTENPVDAKFCISCGLSFYPKSPPNNIFEPPPTAATEEQITEQFLDLLQQKIDEEQDPEKYPAYLKRFEDSGFKHTFELRVRQLAEQIDGIRKKSVRPQTETNQLLEDALDGLSDYFLIRHCADLNRVALPEAILKYEQVDIEQVDLSAMILDYLQFEQEQEPVFTNFLELPIEKLKNASQSFLFPAKDERILFICDQSVLGSFKEGFAMTNLGLYWKAHFEKARKVYYRELQSIEKEKEWIRINQLFFNVNPSLNVKMLKLLRKVRRMYLAA